MIYARSCIIFNLKLYVKNKLEFNQILDNSTEQGVEK